jgi:hypothetical protein
LKLLLDAHHSPSVAIRLRGLGHDASAAGNSHELSRLPDEQLLRLATAEGRALVTEDTGDLLRVARFWSQTGEDHAGIILTPPKRFRLHRRAYPENLVRALAVLLDDPPDQHNLIWWLADG